jgi:hypothetical protein
LLNYNPSRSYSIEEKTEENNLDIQESLSALTLKQPTE